MLALHLALENKEHHSSLFKDFMAMGRGSHTAMFASWSPDEHKVHGMQNWYIENGKQSGHGHYDRQAIYD